MPETLIAALDELTAAWEEARDDPAFNQRQDALRRDFIGRPTPLYLAERLSERVGSRVYLKREDLAHTGAHKINNALGQTLLAERMGKPRIIAETGAGQHGVATATACALLGLECVVYMGTEDIRRQAPNVERMKLLGAEVAPVEAGARTLKEAVSAAIRDWVANVETTHYVIGSAVGPGAVSGAGAGPAAGDRRGGAGAGPRRRGRAAGPGDRLRRRRLQRDRHLRPVRRRRRRRAGRGRGGRRRDRDRAATAPRSGAGSTGVLHGSLSAIVTDEDGQILEAHSVSAGLDYPGVGPGARLPARHRPRLLLLDHRRTALGGARANWPGSRASSRRWSPPTRSPGCWRTRSRATASTSLPLRPRRQGPGRVPRRGWTSPDGVTDDGEERIRAAFAAPPRTKGRAALMPYMMAGFPDRDSGSPWPAPTSTPAPT